MKVEISKAQKEELGKKIALCVDFLKKEIQPHLIPSDKLEIAMGDVLDLYITSKKFMSLVQEWLVWALTLLPVPYFS